MFSNSAANVLAKKKEPPGPQSHLIQDNKRPTAYNGSLDLYLLMLRLSCFYILVEVNIRRRKDKVNPKEDKIIKFS